MDGIHPRLTATAAFSFLLLILLQMSAEAQDTCSAPLVVPFDENNAVGAVVFSVTTSAGVTLAFRDPPQNNPFSINGNQVVADRVLDYETNRSFVVKIDCSSPPGTTFETRVVLNNVNDNPPVFEFSTYYLNANEMSPIDTKIGRITATDSDGNRLNYALISDSDAFKLNSSSNPDILVRTPLEYDKHKTVRMLLEARDLPLTSSSTDPLFSTTTTIVVTILDVDNRPPWFLPCTEYQIGATLICQNQGYTGTVVQNEREPEALELKPKHIEAIDGDKGILATITYSILSGNDLGLFEINSNTGNISMLKPAVMLETISLTVLASQMENPLQVATTTVQIAVTEKSLHHPQFQSPQYECVVTGVGIMAMDLKNTDKPLQILATDEDYTDTGGLNPYITYSLNDTSFFLINGFLFMTNDRPEGTSYLEVFATDYANGQEATAKVLVEVTSGLSTTSVPLSTTIMDTSPTGESTSSSNTTEEIVSTTNPTIPTDSTVSTTIPTMTTASITGESTSSSKTTEDIVSTTNPTIPTDNTVSTTNPTIPTDSTVSTTIPTMTSDSITEDSVSTANPSQTSDGSVSTASTAHTVKVPSGDFTAADMAALGATLGVLLFICLVALGVLICHLQRGKADWQKIYETSMFRSSLGQGSSGQKVGIQFTNEAFQKDEDGDSAGTSSPKRGSILVNEDLKNSVYDTSLKSSEKLHFDDDDSQTGSDKADDKVKPILTKERRMDDGYKSVWFKEDIDPNAKEEMVIIPDSRENDSEEDEEEEQPSSSSRDEDDDDTTQIKTPRAVFNDTDLDSGLGVKMEDQGEDSEDDENMNVAL